MSAGFYNSFTTPMINGMVGIGVPIVVNMMIASMNPTTFANFLMLMSKTNTSASLPYGYNQRNPSVKFPDLPFFTELVNK